MRRFLISTAALVGLCSHAHATLVTNPGIFPSASFATGNCIQATGPNSVASTGTPCGSGAGSGNITGPTSSTIGAIAVWSNGTGTGLADSAILAANIPLLGATQTWAGINTFTVRPVFNGQTPYDTGNLPTALAPYLLSATAASTYLTIVAAQQTYATISGVQSAYMPFTGGTFTGAVTFNLAPTYTGAATAFRGTHITTNNVLRWNLGADGAETGSNTGSDFHLYGYNDAGVFQGAAITVTRSNLTANFLNRPTFAGAVAWDALNFDPSLYLTTAAAASTYLTQANAAATYTTPAEVNTALATFLTKADAASTYLSITTAASTYLTQTNAALVYLTQTAAQQTYATIAGVQSAYLRISDAASTYLTIANAATTYLTQTAAAALYLTQTTAASTYLTIANAAATYLTPAQGDARYIRTTGGGLPYDITWTTQGLNVPLTPIPSSTVILQYEFVRNVTIPVAFSGSRATARAVATNTTNILVESSRYGLMGNLVFTGGATKPDGIWSITATGPFNFQAGDTLTLVTVESAGNPNITDPTLAGISGTILGALN